MDSEGNIVMELRILIAFFSTKVTYYTIICKLGIRFGSYFRFPISLYFLCRSFFSSETPLFPPTYALIINIIIIAYGQQ